MSTMDPLAFVTDGLKNMNAQWVTDTLLGTYFGSWRTHEIVMEAMRNSHCFGLFTPSASGIGVRQIGFCRIITDQATFSWLADVVIDPREQRKGYGSFLIEAAMARASGAVYLNTRDRHDFYAKFGFVRLGDSNVMRRIPAKATDKP